ncbi:MAG: glycoside hydrolase family 16 protein [Planctomycetota bacterium]|jgi:hypothetical protein
MTLNVRFVGYQGSLAAIACTLAVTCVRGAAGTPAPSIEITSVPPYAAPDAQGYLHGAVTGVDFATHRVATYIQIEGSGWWNKPTHLGPTVPIDPDGTFTVDVDTDPGNLDSRATIYLVALVPADATPPTASGARGVPASLMDIALATDIVERYGRTLIFAGRIWAVKEAPVPVGPGGNLFSLAAEDVYVDAAGHLHLWIRDDDKDGVYTCSEVILLDRLGYGTYSFQTNSRLDVLDIYVTFAGFTWDPYGDDDAVPDAPNRELDVEDSSWGNPGDPDNAQFAVQPTDVPGNWRRYLIPDLTGDAALTRFFTWEPCRVRFVALRGHHSPFDFPDGSLIHEWTYTQDPPRDHLVPAPERAAFRLNLWLNHPDGAPASGEPIEVVITDFSFWPGEPPLPCPWDLDGDCIVSVTDFLALLAQWGTNPGGPPDFDGGGVGVTDFLLLLAHWGPCP